jgi:hypothetical protein
MSGGSAIWLCESHIDGRFLCVGTTINATGMRAVHADRMIVGGAVRMVQGFSASRTIRMTGAQIGGNLDLQGAQVGSSTGPAIVVNSAIVGGDFVLIPDPLGNRPAIHGSIDMFMARISGQLLVRDATLEGSNPTHPRVRDPSAQKYRHAIHARQLSVGAEVVIEGESKITGEIDLAMSEASSLTVAGGSVIRMPDGTALDLTNAELRSDLTLSRDVTIHGTVRLTGAKIHGGLVMRGARLDSPDTRGELPTLIRAEGAVIDGDVELREMVASGGALRFRNAMLGGLVHADGARIINPGGYTLNLHQATIKGSVRLGEGFHSEGIVILNRCLIEGRLECTSGRFQGSALPANAQRDHAIEAISATIRGGIDLGWQSISPSVDFTNASTTFLADSPENWPLRFIISGFSYDRFQQPQGSASEDTWDTDARCRWLARQMVFDSGPYEQAARVFRQHGYTSEAERVLIAQRRQARKFLRGRGAVARRTLDRVYGVVVGYGYRPGRVLWLLAALLIIVAASLEVPAARSTMRATSPTGAVYTTQGPLVPPDLPAKASQTIDSCGNGQVRCFSPVLYAIDTVIPLISLDQRSTWYPDSDIRYGTLMQWWLDLSTILGWLLSSIFALSLSRLARSI